MSLAPGTRIGPYTISGTLGKGGMGEVYRALDSKLKRDVAIKVIPGNLSQDAGRLARFEREALLLASLNHPNIAAIYGFEEWDGNRCLVLELVEGETLEERLSRGSLPVDEVLRISHQVSSALEAAHEKGIIHRDLKPANIKITPEGTIKVLDFGLAKAIGDRSPAGSGHDGSLSPTVGLDETRDGAILGTIPYMSPEQARGRPVDRRTDIWSMGCVLFESLTGRRPVDGDTPADVLARILTFEPDFTLLPPETPGFLGRMIRRCLDKDPRRRLRDAGEMRFTVEEFLSNPDSEILGGGPVPRKRFVFASFAPWIIAVILAAPLAYSLSDRGAATRTSSRASVWSVPLPPDSRLSRLGMPGPGGRFDYSRLLAVPPDGKRIAYAVQDDQRHVELYLRELDSVESKVIPGTTDARGPFFSPDGEWIGFLSYDAIRKVSLAGGSPQFLCHVGRAVSFDASWSPDGETIVFATDDGIWRVSADGGTPEQLTRPDPERGEIGHHAPRVLPDGRHVLFTVSITPDTHLALLSLEERTWEVVIRNASQGVTVGDDRVLFARAGELLSAPFDPANHRTTGSPVSVLQGIHTLPGLGGVVLTSFDLSENGTLVYLPAPATDPPDQLLWVDKDGSETPITGGPGTWVHPRLSPSGQRISVDIHSPDGMRDVYIFELARSQLRQLTKTGTSWESEWHPDGEEVAILSHSPEGAWSLFQVRTDFSEKPVLLVRGRHLVPASWFPDGESLLYTELDEGIWRVKIGQPEHAAVVMSASAGERHPRLSPDGRWIAYTANESGRREVFVQSFPDLGPKYQISIDGGGEPVWSPDGRTLFFREGSRMLASDIRNQHEFSAGRPRVLFQGAYDAAPLTGHQHFDVSRDGERFLMVKHGDPPGPSEVRVVLNWNPGG